MIVNISKDMILPKDEWDEGEWLEKVKGLGIKDIMFWDGVDIEIDSSVVKQSEDTYNGSKIFVILGKIGEWFFFTYGSEGNTYDLKYVNGNFYKTVCQIPIEDQFEALL